jgi:hypothetical protein
MVATLKQVKMDALNQEVRDIWNQNAHFWDERMGEGNAFHKILIEPTQERLLNLAISVIGREGWR